MNYNKHDYYISASSAIDELKTLKHCTIQDVQSVANKYFLHKRRDSKRCPYIAFIHLAQIKILNQSRRGYAFKNGLYAEELLSIIGHTPTQRQPQILWRDLRTAFNNGKCPLLAHYTTVAKKPNGQPSVANAFYDKGYR
jgi:hypothetical protein